VSTLIFPPAQKNGRAAIQKNKHNAPAQPMPIYADALAEQLRIGDAFTQAQILPLMSMWRARPFGGRFDF
jgi:hypothetical protein